jgi:two-component system sensor histidine kinase CpxA
MSRLAIKIFGWIWLAFFLLLAGFTIAIDMVGQDTAPQALGEPQLRQWQQHQERVQDIFQRRGMEGLTRFAQDMHANRGINFYLLDSAAKDVLGQDVPPSVRDFFLVQRDNGPRMQKVEQRLLMGPAPFPVPALNAQVLLWQPLTDALSPPVSGLWRGPHAKARLGVAIAVSGLVSLLLALSLTRPLRKLQIAAQRLAQGDFNADGIEAAAHRRDEIGDLAREFKTMAIQLKSLLESRKRLLRDVSHELRSPLARLQVAIELADRQAGPDNGLRFDRMEIECERLNAMIGGVLALSRAEQDDVNLPAKLFDLAATLQELVSDAQFEGQIENKMVELQAPKTLQYVGHQALISSAIENVLRNALRYAPPASTVNVALQVHRAWLEITISDSGPGVPEQELERIFEPFHRVPQSPGDDGHGTGVGLAIAARAMQRHGGKIMARRRTMGGLELAMTLPVQPAKALPKLT